MKCTVLTFVTLLVFSMLPAHATVSVVDVSAIKVSLANAKQALAEQILHGKRQIEMLETVEFDALPGSTARVLRLRGWRCAEESIRRTWPREYALDHGERGEHGLGS